MSTFMAGMGQTGVVNITKAMMEAAIQAIDDYQAAITNLNARLGTEIDGLIPSSFSGSAATGFKTFYDSNIVPNTGEKLTKMLDSLRGICESVKTQIPGEDQGVDEQLGHGNQNPGGSASN